MILLSAFFPTTPERAKELEFCLEHNILQPFFEHVVILCEGGGLPNLSSNKITFVDMPRRMVYGDFFQCANQFHSGQICVVSNTDVMYDETLDKFNHLPFQRWENRLFAITRTNEDGRLQNPGSQDTWVFKAPLQKFDGWKLILGIIGCDSFLAQKALEADMEVENPALSIRCLHRHRVGVRNDMLPVEGSDKKTCYWESPGYKAVGISYSLL
jgi:hypothetical protein